TRRRRRGKSRPCDAASPAAPPWATSGGRSAPRTAWDWSPRCVPADDLEKSRMSPFPLECPLFLCQTKGEVEAVRRSIARGAPLGDERWTKRTAARLGLESSLRPRGRPRKK